VSGGALPHVALIVTGGTITALGAGRVDPLYGEPNRSLGASQLVERVPELAAIARVVPVAFAAARSSHELTFDHWRSLVVAIREQLASDADGVVITHGTNTLEETSYFLELTVRSEKPVVVTGAMRAASALSGDGDANLLNAVRVAAADASRGRGVLVVLDDSIHSARDVIKTSTYRMDAFQAPDRGPLGHAFVDEVRYRRTAPRSTLAPFDVAGLRELPPVVVVPSYLGADGALIEAAVKTGAAGIVHAGTGGGRATPAEEEALARAAASGTVVCRCTRVPSGRVAMSAALREHGFVAAGELDAWRSRVLLALALTRTQDPEEIQGIFDAEGSGG
jgi:L-asparaginase